MDSELEELPPKFKVLEKVWCPEEAMQTLYGAHVRKRRGDIDVSLRERTNKASCIFVCIRCFHRVRHEPVGESVTLECRIEGCRGAMNELHD